MIQVAWAVVDQDAPGSAQARLIKPEGFEIEPGAARVHGITTDHALKHGVELRPVLDDLAAAIASADAVVAHNLNFDLNVVGSEFLRAKMDDVFAGKGQRCSMQESTDLCALPGRRGYGYKWPSLGELHHHLFQCGFDGAHDASADMLACMKCFFELIKTQAIPK